MKQTQRPSMATAIQIISLAVILSSAQACLNPLESADKCTACTVDQVLLQSRCYDKLRGCLEYRIEVGVAKCKTCLNGYEMWEGICQRSAIVQILKGEADLKKLNNPPPVAVDNSQDLTKTDLASNSTAQAASTSSTNSKSSSENLSGNTSNFEQQIPIEIYEEYERSQKSLNELPKDLSQQISAKFPELSNQRILHSEINETRGCVFYADGSILFVIIAQQAQPASSKYEIDKIFNPRYAKIYKSFLDEQLKGVGEVTKASFAINYEVTLTDSSKPVSLIQSIGSDQIYVDSRRTGSSMEEQLLKILQAYNRRKQLKDRFWPILKSFALAYAQYKDKIGLITVPNTISKILVQAVPTQNNLIFKVFYKETSKSNQSQYAVIRYNTLTNATEIAGYYVEQKNIFAETPTPTFIIADPPKTLPQPTLNVSSVEKYLAEKEDYRKLVQKGAMSLAFSGSATSFDQIVYELKFLASEGVFLARLVENVTVSSFSHTIAPVTGAPKCAVLPTNDSILQKINQYLRSSYPILSSYENLQIDFSIGSEGEDYSFIYSSWQDKKIKIGITKSRETLKFKINSSYALDDGYYFPSAKLRAQSIDLDQVAKGGNQSAEYKLFLPYLSVLSEKFGSYVQGARLQSILTNQTHSKIYVQTQKAVYQYFQENFKDEGIIKVGSLSLLQSKIKPQSILPPGFDPINLITQEHPNYQRANQIKTSLYNKYRLYLGGGSYQYYIQKLPSSSSQATQYDFVIETITGCFRLTATDPVGGAISEIVFGYLQKMNPWYIPTFVPNCLEEQIVDPLNNICFQRIPLCRRQVSEVCLLCEVGSSLAPNRKVCSPNCLKVEL